MSLARTVRNAVATADRIAGSLQAEVAHSAWIGNDGFGGALYAEPVMRPAIIERKDRLLRAPDGVQIRSEHVVTFLRPIPPNGAEGRDEPVDPRDRVVLPDGSTGPITSVDTVVDPLTGAGYYQQVSLGAARY